jgi:hypothetical protein
MKRSLPIPVIACLLLGAGVAAAQERWRGDDDRSRWRERYDWRDDDRRGPPDRSRDGRGMEHGYGSGMDRGTGRGMGGARFALVDQNNDGVVSTDEAAAHFETVFAEVDANDDDELSREEFLGFRRGGDAMRSRRDERFGVMDADKDGKVSHAEFLEAHRAMFATADADKDGKVTPWEFRSQRWRWR